MSDFRDPMDSSLPGSPVHGISQARNWSGLPFPSPRFFSFKVRSQASFFPPPNGYSVWVKWSHSVVSDSLQPRGLAPQTPPPMGFSRQEYWSGLPSPSPGDLPNPGIKPRSPALQADALPSELKGLEAVKRTRPIKAILMVLHRNYL